MIKKFDPQTPQVSRIGIVEPSTGAIKSAISLQRSAANMLDNFYQKAVEEQQEKGAEFAMQVPLRGEDGRLKYEPIPDSMSPVAKRTARSQIDQRFETQLRVDLAEKARTFRFKKDGSPASAAEYETAMETYLKETGELNPRFQQYAQDYASPLIAQNLADIRHQSYNAAMKKDFNNRREELEQVIIPAIAATAQAGQTVEMPNGDMVDSASLMYQRTMAAIDDFEQTHSSRIEGGLTNKLRKAAKEAFYGGKVDSITAKISAATKANISNIYLAANEEKTVLNDVVSVLRNPASYDAIPEYRQKQLASLGFTKEFATNPDMAAVRNEVATRVAAYEGTRSEIFTQEKKRLDSELSINALSQGFVIGQGQVDNIATQLGINDRFEMVAALPGIMASGTAENPTHPLKNALMGDGALPTALTEAFSNQDVLQFAASRGFLPQLINIYEQATTRFVNGSPIRTDRGMSPKAIANMETLAAYGSILQTVDVGEFLSKTSEFNRFGVDQRKSITQAALGEDYSSVAEFVSKTTGIETTRELGDLMAIAPSLIHVHGVETTKKILKQSADKLYRKSDFMYEDTPSMHSPEARYGSQLHVFKSSANMALGQAAGKYSLEAGNAKLIFDRRGGGGYPVYLAVDAETGIPIMGPDNTPIRVGGIAVMSKLNREYQEQAKRYLGDLQEQRFKFLSENLGTGGVQFVP